MKALAAGQNGGYLVNLYKRIVTSGMQINRSDFAFITWMNFDGMCVTNISSFEQFGQAPAMDEAHQFELYCEKQSVYLLPLSAEFSRLDATAFGDIFSHGGAYSQSYPLVLFTLLTLRTQDKEELNTISAKIRVLSDRYQFNYRIFQTLAVEQVAIVFRSSQYTGLSYALDELQLCAPIEHTYSVPGIDLDGVDAWTEPQSAHISVRMSLYPTHEDGWKDEHVREFCKDDALENISCYSTFGKFDADLSGDLKSTLQFTKLFDVGGELDLFRANPAGGLLSTNTRLLFQVPTEGRFGKAVTPAALAPFSTKPPIIPTGAEDFQSEVSALVAETKAGGHTPQIEGALLHQIQKLFQAARSFYTQHSGQDVFRVGKMFINMANRHAHDCNYLVDVQDGIESLHDYLDNCLTAHFRDFEVPHPNSKYTGASATLLRAYSRLIDRLLQYLADGEPGVHSSNRRRYTTFVTTSSLSSITASLFFYSADQNGRMPDPSDQRLLDVRIPAEMLFMVNDVLEAILHEIGHYAKAGWSRKERNEAFSKALVRFVNQQSVSMFHKTQEAYEKKATAADKKNYAEKRIAHFSTYMLSCLQKELTAIHVEAREGVKLDYLVNRHQIRLAKALEQFARESERGSPGGPIIPSSDMPDAISHLSNTLLCLEASFREAIADLFLVATLDIRDPDRYLSILIRNLDFAQFPPQDIPLDILLRVFMVLSVLAPLSEGAPTWTGWLQKRNSCLQPYEHGEPYGIAYRRELCEQLLKTDFSPVEQSLSTLVIFLRNCVYAHTCEKLQSVMPEMLTLCRSICEPQSDGCLDIATVSRWVRMMCADTEKPVDVPQQDLAALADAPAAAV